VNGGIESDTQAVVMSVTGNQAIYVTSRVRGGAASLYIVHRCIDEKENEPGGDGSSWCRIFYGSRSRSCADPPLVIMPTII
jgi:hypothetical protein